MPEQLHARVEACYQRAEAHFKRSFRRPEVSLRLRGQKAGVAHLQENLLRFNPTLYAQNREDFLRQTVPHEVAHLIAQALYGRRIRPHGAEWQTIMREVFALQPLRCHSYAVQRRPVTRFVYLCACPEQDFAFSAQRHRLVARGTRYFCRRCKATLSYSGEQRTE
jgi:SprT protein